MQSNTHLRVDLHSLPKSQPYWGGTGTSKKNDGHSTSSSPLILVVDNERLIADTLVAILRAKSFSAIAAYNGKQGLEVARVLRPGIVICDVLMPGINGVEMSKRVREILPEAQIFLVSGHSSALAIADDGPIPQDFVFLAKPLHPDELVGAVQERLRKKN